VHHLIAAVILTVLGVTACGWVLDIPPGEEEEAPPRFTLPPKSALLIGAVGFLRGVRGGGEPGLVGGVPEGPAGYVGRGSRRPRRTGFMLTMAVARLVGDGVVNRFGSVRTVRAGGVLSVFGGLLIVLAENPALTMVGFALLGLGIAVVVPLCFAAAGRKRPQPEPGDRGRRDDHLHLGAGRAEPDRRGGAGDEPRRCRSAWSRCGRVGLVVFAGVLRAGDRGRPKVSPPSAAVVRPTVPEPLAPGRGTQRLRVQPDEDPGTGGITSSSRPPSRTGSRTSGRWCRAGRARGGRRTYPVW